MWTGLTMYKLALQFMFLLYTDSQADCAEENYPEKIMSNKVEPQRTPTAVCACQHDATLFHSSILLEV